METWIATELELPPEGIEVFGMNSSGEVMRFKRRGRVWLIGPTFSTYVYYEPKFWKPTEKQLEERPVNH